MQWHLAIIIQANVAFPVCPFCLLYATYFNTVSVNISEARETALLESAYAHVLTAGLLFPICYAAFAFLIRM